MSILRLVDLFRPEAECGLGFVAEELDEGDVAPGHRPVQLFVDEVVGELDGGRILTGVCVIDPVDAGSVDSPEAHGAGFTRGVDDAAVQVEGVQGAAGRPNGIDLGVGRGIVVEGDAVGSGGDDFPILHDDGPERTTPACDTFYGQQDSLAHERFVRRVMDSAV